MAKSPKVKCKYCGKLMDREDAVQLNSKGRYFHEECLEKFKKEQTDKGIDEAGRALEKEELRQLTDYIQELFGKNANFPMIMTQVHRFKKQHEMRFKGMELSLKYFYEVLGHSVKEGHGVGIIPWVYEQTKEHHKSINNIKKIMAENPQLVTEKKVAILIKEVTPIDRRNYDISDL